MPYPYATATDEQLPPAVRADYEKISGIMKAVRKVVELEEVIAKNERNLRDCPACPDHAARKREIHAAKDVLRAMKEGPGPIDFELLRALELFDALTHDLSDIAAESDIDRARLKRVIARLRKESARQQKENAKQQEKIAKQQEEIAKLNRDLVAAK